MTPKYPGKPIVWLVAALTLVLYLLSKPTLAALGNNVFVSLAQISALVGTVLFSLSFILASRTLLIEEAFGGLDRAYRFHHKIGVWSFSFLVTHFACVLIGYGINGSPIFSMLAGNLVFITGEIGIVAMAAIILTIIYAKIKYQNFVLIQKFFAIPYAFGAYHLLIVTSDVSRYHPLRLFMIAMIALGAIAWIWREFFYRSLGPQAEYEVKAVEEKCAGIAELTLSPLGAPLRYKAGQFAYFTFHSPAVTSESHPFSFTSSPDEPVLRFAAKALGDFTNTLKNAKPGDRVTVYGPYGKFFSELDPGAENIFIAGGIGVTPFLSALREQKGCQKTTIFYTTKSEVDCAYGQELFDLSCSGNAFHYHFHGSEQRGYLSADIIEKRAGGLAGKKIYLCGPTPMMRLLTEGLIKKGVHRSNIVFEAFNY